MIYPTLTEIENADRFQICKWWRFLPSPVNEDQVKINQRLSERFKEVDGFTPAISKALGWKNEF